MRRRPRPYLSIIYLLPFGYELYLAGSTEASYRRKRQSLRWYELRPILAAADRATATAIVGRVVDAIKYSFAGHARRI